MQWKEGNMKSALHDPNSVHSFLPFPSPFLLRFCKSQFASSRLNASTWSAWIFGQLCPPSMTRLDPTTLDRRAHGYEEQFISVL